jgi:uncharacterized protein
MSQQNVELIRDAYERWRAGGATSGAIPVEIYADDVEWDLSAYPLVDLPSHGRGRDNLLNTFAKYLSGWRDYRPDAREFIDAGQHVVVVLHEQAQIADSDVVLEREVFQVWTLRDRLVTKWRVFQTREEALRAVGLA